MKKVEEKIILIVPSPTLIKITYEWITISLVFKLS